jgi:hypothetical protein
MSLVRPVFPAFLPLPCFFSGTTGTLGKKPPVTRSVTGFELSHLGWDTGPFGRDTVGHFVPVATFCTVQRKINRSHCYRLVVPGCVNFGAKAVPPAAVVNGDFGVRT